MNSAEKESFTKSFWVFFVSLTALSAILSYMYYVKLQHDTKENLYNQMRLCSYDLKCSQFRFDFVPLQSQKLYRLNESPQELFALFSIPKNDTYALKLSLSNDQYQHMLYASEMTLIEYFALALVIIGVISALFSLYALSPLRRALHLTEEFSRDILHDLGTPLSSLRLNVSRLHVAQGDEKKLDRINGSIETIISLGDNLRSYLDGHPSQRETLEIEPLLHERISHLQKLYPDIRFSLTAMPLKLNANRDALIRIIDNLLTNAAKYNTPTGSVSVELDHLYHLRFKDTGKGIEHPEKIFNRFYKEQERGIGIGLNIVKKLCDEMGIGIRVESRRGKGSVFTLDLRALTLR